MPLPHHSTLTHEFAHGADWASERTTGTSSHSMWAVQSLSVGRLGNLLAVGTQTSRSTLQPMKVHTLVLTQSQPAQAGATAMALRHSGACAASQPPPLYPRGPPVTAVDRVSPKAMPHRVSVCLGGYNHGRLAGGGTKARTLLFRQM